MKKMNTVALLSATILTVSCVSKKKYTELETRYDDTRVSLTKTQVEKEELEAKYSAIENRVADYNSKINSLRDDNYQKLDLVENLAVMSESTKDKMRETLSKVDQNELAQAKSLEDSMNLAISYNLKKNLDDSVGEDEDIQVDIDETVVMINVSDKLLFNSGSYRVSNKADGLLKRLADVINSEPAIEVMVEGHTDDQTVKPGAYIKDNWELSVERSTAIIRELQDKYNVDPAKLIAAGRSSYLPLVDNATKEDRAKNRRTRIVILPNLDKFLSMVSSTD
ncbi:MULTISPECIES: OmpA/MotB family protein [Leeuwenhoekiella]|jgi:chemotaxis protein MotB|uniref:OmpA/MotB family protein n=1 Tax=Leeuwenhoekiella TaxID=283735 RepID=UPI000C6768D0|nr:MULTISPECIES: flagellar motor protein MotB [Leeuwenhoekiella]MAO44463.1 cell envelope biogenesis protein OmpA [Leeuwenhoekiella sp.]MBQ52590.1 cell envelope biogenesis protein OmpA [Leeuwenhoekiella sp.]HBT11525.1 cell envelope biogenesis protein OmpA [Leeuwenhoekiella sp.]HCW65132.1 cell envelope biogenesis protein OmpA [Leeuwenhoekiella sp.]|tara:strand:+ start:1911 stop:2750 length:840 start_codon:yes stop_codon:yes gene_type:complete